MGIFALREAWMRIYFFRDSWIYIFPVFHFFVSREIYINLGVICEPTPLTGVSFHFFGDLSNIKARKLHQATRCKTCLFEALADGGLRTNHSSQEKDCLASIAWLWQGCLLGIFLWDMIEGVVPWRYFVALVGSVLSAISPWVFLVS